MPVPYSVGVQQEPGPCFAEVIEAVTKRFFEFGQRAALSYGVEHSVVAKQSIVSTVVPFVRVQSYELMCNLKTKTDRVKAVTIRNRDAHPGAKLIGKLARRWRESYGHE